MLVKLLFYALGQELESRDSGLALAIGVVEVCDGKGEFAGGGAVEDGTVGDRAVGDRAVGDRAVGARVFLNP